MTLDRTQHPCFNPNAAHERGRIHLPVAPKCNIQCNYCDRKHDCANENRPGVSSALLAPGQAMAYLDRFMNHDARISVVGIAGPGDAFASPEPTLETLRRVREKYPDMLLCVASNGFNVAPYAEDLAELDVTHVTITLNCLDPEIGSNIYAWVRDDKRVYRGVDAARVLIDRQLQAIRALKENNVTVKINSILIPGINDLHLAKVAEAVAEMGVDLYNCMPMHPTPNTPLEYLGEPDAKTTARVRLQAMRHVPQMMHCSRCRADAAGMLGQDDVNTEDWLKEAAVGPLELGDQRPYIAAASLEGVLVNQHLGEADSFWVFEQQNGGFEMVGRRDAPPQGGGDNRWKALAQTLNDCRALLVHSAGSSPINVLQDEGVRVIRMEGMIEEGLRSVYEGSPLRAPVRDSHRCGSGCSGDGMGCG